MNAGKIIFAALLVALMALAYAPSVPVAATSTGVEVLTQVVTVDNSIYFVINLTYLRETFGWVGTTADIYLSNNGYGNINVSGIDIPIVKGIYIADADYIMGTLYIDSDTVAKLNVTNNDYLWIKISDGSNVAASNRFYVLLNITEVFKANTYNLSKTAYSDSYVQTSNILNLTVNISSVAPTVNLTQQNVSIVLYNSIEGKNLFVYKHVNNTTVIESDILDLANNSKVLTSEVYVNGTLKDFALGGVNDFLTVQGITVAFEKFNFAIQAASGTVTYSNVIPVYNNVVTSAVPVASHTIPNVTLNIGSLDKSMSIFPSVELVGYTELAGNASQINPGDNITVKLYNFVGNDTLPISICLFVYQDGKLVTITTNDTVNATYGNATVTVTLPEAQYGGRDFFIAAKQGTSIRGLPATNATTAADPALIKVMPYLDIALVYNNGTFSKFNAKTTTAPGDYVIVKGHGFLQETITATIFYNGSDVATLSFKADFYGATSVTVDEDGLFFAVFQIPADVNTTLEPFVFSAYGDTATNRGFSIVSFTYKLDGTEYKVFVNPAIEINTAKGMEPEAANITQADVDPAYPAATPWLSELAGFGNFVVEAIGIPFTDGSIVVTTDNTTFYTVTSVTFSNGYFMGTVDVPTVPYGDYYVGAYDGTNYYGGYEKKVFVRETARVIDPTITNETVYRTELWIGEPTNVTVVGYGWPGAATVTYTISIGTKSYSETFTTNADGTFSITANISKFLETYGNGTYTLTVQYNATIYKVFTIYYNVTPPVSVEVYTGTLKLTVPGDTADIYAIVYVGSNLFNPASVYNYSVTVSVYYYEDGTLKPLTVTKDNTTVVLENVTMEYTGKRGIWHYAFEIPAEAMGKDLLVQVYAKVQPKDYMIPQSDVAFASFTVAESLTELLTSIQSQINSSKNEIINKIDDIFNKLDLKLESINGKLVVVSTTLNNTYADVSYLINLAHAINANLSLVMFKLEQINGSIANSTEQINTNIGMLYLAITGYANAILSNQSAILDNQEAILVKLNVTLDKLDMLIEKVDNNTAIIISKIGKVETNVSMLIDDLNSTLVGFIVNKTGEVIGKINTSEGNITATLEALYNLTEQGLMVAKEEVLASIANLSANLTTYATKICDRLKMLGNETMTKLDTIEELINASKSAVMNSIITQAAGIKGAINTKAGEIIDAINGLNNTVNAKTNSIYNETKNLGVTMTNLINTNTQKVIDTINTKVDALSQKLDQTAQDLSSKIEQSNSDVKGRVTTMSSISTVVLLAAIVAMSVISRGAKPT